MPRYMTVRVQYGFPKEYITNKMNPCNYKSHSLHVSVNHFEADSVFGCVSPFVCLFATYFLETARVHLSLMLTYISGLS